MCAPWYECASECTRARAFVIAFAKGRLEFTGLSVHMHDGARPEYGKIDLTKFFFEPKYRVPRVTAHRRERWVGRKRVAAVVVVGAARLVVAMKTCLALPHPLLYALTPT